MYESEEEKEERTSVKQMKKFCETISCDYIFNFSGPRDKRSEKKNHIIEVEREKERVKKVCVRVKLSVGCQCVVLFLCLSHAALNSSCHDLKTGPENQCSTQQNVEKIGVRVVCVCVFWTKNVPHASQNNRRVCVCLCFHAFCALHGECSIHKIAA